MFSRYCSTRSKTMLTTWRQWCRLCAKEHSTINIFSKNEHDCDIAELVRRFFQLSINTFDEAPVTICAACYSFLVSVHRFEKRLTKAEAMYSALMCEEINASDYASVRYQFGLMKDDLNLFVSHCNQSTDTADLTLKFPPTKEHNDETPVTEAAISLQNEEKAVLGGAKETIEPNIEQLDAFEQVSIENGEEEREIFEGVSADYSDDDDESDSVIEDKNDMTYEPKSKAQLSESANKKGRKLNEPNLQCNKCEKIFLRRSALRRHKRMDHVKGEKTEFACKQCAKKFPTLQRAQQHSVVHLDPDQRPAYPCPHCTKTYPKTSNLQTHIRTIHIGERPFICESCGKAFATRGALKEHNYSHIEDRPFQCSTCRKSFKTRATLKIHEDIHNGTVYQCTNCGLILNTKRTLQMHMVVHSDQKKHKCKVCNREFKRSKTLKTHMILHSGLRPYACPFCDKTFVNGSHYRSHKKKIHPTELAAMEANDVGEMANIHKMD